MSFKLVLRVVRSDAATGDWLPLDATPIRQCIVQAGGQLLEEVESGDKLKRLKARMEERRIWTLGVLGPECVMLYRSDFVGLALGYGPNPAALAFLRMMVAEGCTIWTEDGESTDSILETIAVTDARWAAQKKA